ncbi:MAG TPA: M20/M25/M40 family metallo-hydrolase [Polyangia bacterium]|jgi:Acetylornithine deacetylase/Succinyl-diaminopimelate desuccinylase and related deacylases|nr:M20/M25/M40 family metallo-hydrolase [Polyangia bacterium]
MSKQKLHSRSNLRGRSAGLRREFEEKLAALVGIPSVSMDPSRRADVERVAHHAVELLRDLGARAECIETAGLPLVLGRLVQDPKYPTVTIYNHLDVQPAEADEWRTPPFKLVRDGDRWHGRGTTDDKGPALAALFGTRLALQDGVRLNFQFLWETEEEMGSPSFQTALRKLAAGDRRRAPLRTDSILVSDTQWPQAGRPAIPYGLRGLLGFCVRLRTGDKDVHSGTTGGAARNPLGELCALINDCYDVRTGRVKIPGFYRDVRRLGAAERRQLASAGFSRRGFQRAHGLSSVRFSDDARLCEATTIAPTFEVHGLTGGYSGAGIKTIVPHQAEAKLSCRLVPDQTPEGVFHSIERFVRQHCRDAEVVHEASLSPYLVDPSGPHLEAAQQAMFEAFGKRPALTREGGSIGAVVTMDRVLRAPVVLLGLSLPEHGYHAVDENFDWGQAGRGMEMFCRYFHKLADLPRGW